jgi:hypothetical protein
MSQQNPNEPTVWSVSGGFRRCIEGRTHIEVEFPTGETVKLTQDALLAAAVVIRDLESPQELPRG